MGWVVSMVLGCFGGAWASVLVAGGWGLAFELGVLDGERRRRGKERREPAYVILGKCRKQRSHAKRIHPSTCQDNRF